MEAVRSVPDGGPQIKFLGREHRPGLLLITCADEPSSRWLIEATNALEPWEGAGLRAVSGSL